MSRQLTIFALFTCAYFLSYFYRSANAIIAPDLRSELNLNAADLGLMTSVFFASFALMQLPLGRLLDRFGVRWVTPTLLLAAIAGSAVFSFADSLSDLLLARVLIGIGMSAVLMGAMKIISQLFNAKQFASLTGLLVGIGSTGALIAATPLAWLNDIVGWRAVFLGGSVVLIVVVILLIMIVRDAPADLPQNYSIDETGWKHVFGQREFWRIALLNFVMAGSLLSFQGLWAGPYLFDVLAMNAISAGNVLLIMGIATTLGYTFSGWLGNSFGIQRLLIIGATLFLISQLILVLGTGITGTMIAYGLFGFSGALGLMTLAEIKQVMPLSLTATAVTSVNLFGIGGTFIIQWVSGLVINSFATSNNGYPPAAYQFALGLMSGMTFLILIYYSWQVIKTR